MRDYGTEGQIGQEDSPEAFISKLVEVFREVKRVLKKDGTLWVNMGDSYAGSGRGPSKSLSGEYHDLSEKSKPYTSETIKAKDLIGIPWALAKALRDPYYNGKIKSEKDRVWIAAILDGEGSISGYEHERKDGTGVRYGMNVCITNSSMDILDECARIWPASRQDHTKNGEGHLGQRRIERWIANGNENRANFLAEVYPYLISKKKQALIGWNLCKMSEVSKSEAKLGRGIESREKRKHLVDILKSLNAGIDVDVPKWCKKIPSLYEDGWYLRQDIIWSKPNPMPESVQDRCTKSHEYIFMLSKSPKYYYDNEAIKTEAKYPGIPGMDASGFKDAKIYDGKHGKRADKQRGHGKRHAGFNDRWDKMSVAEQCSMGANKRSVWEVATRSFREAHFATFPQELITDCIKAGCPKDGIVLDPFAGAGTTLLVANKLGRNAVGIEISEDYANNILAPRLRNELGMFCELTIL